MSRLLVAAVLAGLAAAVHGQAPAAPVAPLSDLVAPAGFRVSVFASGLPGARLMAISPEGVLLVARRRTHEVVALRDDDKDGRAEPEVILTGMTNAHSVAFSGGYLYVATTPAVMRVPWDNGRPLGTPSTFAPMPSDTPSLHSSRTIHFGPDGRLYVSIGSSCDACVEADARRTTIQVYDASGKGQPFATGLRNAIGFDWDPVTGRLWASDNGQDNLGADFPPDEINLVEAGKHYGFPLFAGRNRRNELPAGSVRPSLNAAAAVVPAVELPPHAAVADLHFYRGRLFPAPYRNAMFVTLHGSTAIPAKVGYKVVRVVMKDGLATGVEDFISGWLKGDAVSGRPAGLVTGADGALYISDDHRGFIYRVGFGE